MQHMPSCKNNSEDDVSISFTPSTLYRIRLVALIAARCLRLCCPFQIQVKGPVDHDIYINKTRPWVVIRYKENGIKWRTLWLLAVYPRNPQHFILLSDFLRSGPLSLPLIFESFSFVNQHPNDSNISVVLYTCQKLDSGLKIRRHRMPGTILDQPKYEGGYTFTKTLNPQIYAPNIVGYQDFVKKLYIYTHQPGLIELENMILKEINLLMPNSMETVKKEMKLMWSKMVLWWKVKRFCSKSASIIDEKTFTEWIALGKKIQPIKSAVNPRMNFLTYFRRFDSLKFIKNARNNIKNVLTKTRILTLTAPKMIERAMIFLLVLNAIEKNKSIALNLSKGKSIKDFTSTLDDALAVWSGPLIEYLLISADNDLYDLKLMEDAWYVLRSYPNKRLILVVPGESSLINSLCSEFNGLVYAEKFNFKFLTKKSKQIVYNKNIQIFGEIYPVQNYLPKGEEFKTSWLDDLFKSKPIEIIHPIKELVTYYQEKNIILNNIILKETRVKIIFGLIGSGKTMYLHSKALRALNNKKWSLIIDLVELEMIINYKVKTINKHDMAKILVNLHKDINSSLARACYRQALLSNDEFILYIDGWDDLSKQRKATAAEILEKIVNLNFFPSQNIYITCSNYSDATSLAQMLNGNIYELEPFNNEDEMNMRQQIRSKKMKMKKQNNLTINEDQCLRIWKNILGRPIRIALEMESNISIRDELDPLLILHRVIAKRLGSGIKLGKFTNEIKVAMYYYTSASALLLMPPSKAPISCLQAASRLRQAASCSEYTFDPLIYDWIGVRPRFRMKLIGYYFTSIWLAGSFNKVQMDVLRCLFEPDNTMIRSILDLLLCRQLPLHYAILSGHFPISSGKIRKEDIKKEDLALRTPLHLVSNSCKAVEIAKRLIQISPTCLSKKCGLYYWTPIQYATASRKWELVEMFLRFGSQMNEVQNIVDINEVIAIAEEATRRNYYNLLKCLIQNGVVKVDEIFSLLTIAGQFGSSQCARLLINEGMVIHGRYFLTNNGETLARTISARSLSVASLLIKSGANPHKQGFDGLTAFVQAKEHRPTERLLEIYS